MTNVIAHLLTVINDKQKCGPINTCFIVPEVLK